MPLRAADPSSLVLLSDLNDWSPGYGKTFAPHGKNGPVLAGQDPTNAGANGASSLAIGASGYLQKPFLLDVLAEKVQATLH
jgi:hypothetical protein